MAGFLNKLKSRWGGNSKPSRTAQRVSRTLGMIRIPMPRGSSYMFRKESLHELDSYYESTQYDHLEDWSSCSSNASLYNRKPKINANLPKLVCQRVASKLVGDDVFPKIKVEEDPDTEEYIDFIVKASKIKSRIIEPTRRMLCLGSVFIRFYIDEGSFVIEHFKSKYVYPEISSNGELKSVTIKYIYESDDRDEKGNFKLKWNRIDLSENTDIQYDNPDFDPNSEPVFQEESKVDHNLGFVQGEWFRTMEQKDSVDGYSLVEDILDFSDEINYSLSQSSKATAYNQDPQLLFKNIDEEEMQNVVRSSEKSWNLGREGEASFLESTLTGVGAATELRDKMKTNIVDISRVLLLDPEKVASHAQSGRAMEVLHGPMVDMIKEIRPIFGDNYKNLILKLALSNLILAQRGLPSPVSIPPGYRPKSLSMSLVWPSVFAMTVEDLQKKVSVVSSATSTYLISEETGTSYLAKDFGIDSVEEERAKIDAQPDRNPFGGF